MNLENQVVYSKPLLRSAVRRYWSHTVGFSGLVFTLFLAIVTLGLFLIDERSWVLGGAITVLTIWMGLVGFSYFRLLNMSTDKVRRMDVPTARFRFDNQGVAIEADTGKTEFAWKFVDRILQYPDVWLLILGGGSYVTLPA